MCDMCLSERLDGLANWLGRVRQGAPLDPKGARTFEELLRDCADDARILEAAAPAPRRLTVIGGTDTLNNVVPLARPVRQPVFSTYDPDGAA